MDQIVDFQYGTPQEFKDLPVKDDDTLYFLDNAHVYKGNMLLTNVHTVKTEFKVPDINMVGNYYISLRTGEIKYVDDDLNYINISEFMIYGIVLSPTFMNEFINKIESKRIKMPVIDVSLNSLILTKGTEGEFTVLTDKLKNRK